MPRRFPHVYRGRCFCGSIRVSFEAHTPPRATPLRSCTCTFCLKHGARNTSDPEGRARLEIRRPGRLSRFDFRPQTGGRLLCGFCGAYVATARCIGGRWLATINVNALDRTQEFTQRPRLMDYSGESAAETRARRAAKWTPAEIVLRKR
ncbi:MAG: glutathione-dependent formaldehyde-activating [Planctomycetota bacterium]|nr:MAG: glutathione-dependent formaldehyde-activating [Planctomycetota bacterium]